MMTLGSFYTYHFGFYRFWISRAIKNLTEIPDLFTAGERKNRFKGMEAIGIGSTKVEALKSWLLAMNFIEASGKSNHILTKISESVIDFDPTIETNGTWALIHYCLSTNMPIWNWYSSVFSLNSFNQELMSKELREAYPEVSDDSIKNNRASLIAAMRQTPLGNDFGYFVEKDSVIYKQEPPEELLSPMIFAYSILDWMKRNNRIDVHTSELFKQGGPARIFNLSSDRVNKYLSFIRDNYGKRILWLSRTAGLNSLSVNTDLDPLIPLIAYYQNEVEGESPPDDLNLAMDFYNEKFARRGEKQNEQLTLEGI